MDGSSSKNNSFSQPRISHNYYQFDDSQVEQSVDVFVDRIDGRIGQLELKLGCAWRDVVVLSNEYVKMWEKLEHLEILLYEQHNVIAQLITMVQGNSNNLLSETFNVPYETHFDLFMPYNFGIDMESEEDDTIERNNRFLTEDDDDDEEEVKEKDTDVDVDVDIDIDDDFSSKTFQEWLSQHSVSFQKHPSIEKHLDTIDSSEQKSNECLDTLLNETFASPTHTRQKSLDWMIRRQNLKRWHETIDDTSDVDKSSKISSTQSNRNQQIDFDKSSKITSIQSNKNQHIDSAESEVFSVADYLDYRGSASTSCISDSDIEQLDKLTNKFRFNTKSQIIPSSFINNKNEKQPKSSTFKETEDWLRQMLNSDHAHLIQKKNDISGKGIDDNSKTQENSNKNKNQISDLEENALINCSTETITPTTLTISCNGISVTKEDDKTELFCNLINVKSTNLQHKSSKLNFVQSDDAFNAIDFREKFNQNLDDNNRNVQVPNFNYHQHSQFDNDDDELKLLNETCNNLEAQNSLIQDQINQTQQDLLNNIDDNEKNFISSSTEINDNQTTREMNICINDGKPNTSAITVITESQKQTDLSSGKNIDEQNVNVQMETGESNFMSNKLTSQTSLAMEKDSEISFAMEKDSEISLPVQPCNREVDLAPKESLSSVNNLTNKSNQVYEKNFINKNLADKPVNENKASTGLIKSSSYKSSESDNYDYRSISDNNNYKGESIDENKGLFSAFANSFYQGYQSVMSYPTLLKRDSQENMTSNNSQPIKSTITGLFSGFGWKTLSQPNSPSRFNTSGQQQSDIKIKPKEQLSLPEQLFPTNDEQNLIRNQSKFNENNLQNKQQLVNVIKQQSIPAIIEQATYTQQTDEGQNIRDSIVESDYKDVQQFIIENDQQQQQHSLQQPQNNQYFLLPNSEQKKGIVLKQFFIYMKTDKILIHKVNLKKVFLKNQRFSHAAIADKVRYFKVNMAV